MGPIGCPETLVNNVQFALSNVPEERGSQLKIFRGVVVTYSETKFKHTHFWERNLFLDQSDGCPLQVIKTSAKERLGLHEMKQHKPWFDEEHLGILDQRKQAKMQWIQDPSQVI
jgi:hypothetical protein